ncbi:MAG: hypothetical protein ACT4PT_02495, partial [Methanobacteriota archaeon]
MRGALPILAVLVVLPAAAPALAAGEPPGERVVTDPEGDARENNNDMAWRKIREDICDYGLNPISGFACQTATPSTSPSERGPGGETGGLPASPALDALAAYFEETPVYLLVHLELAGLDASLEGLTGENEEGAYGGWYSVEWTNGRGCGEVVYLVASDGAVPEVDFEYGAVVCQGDVSEHPWAGGCSVWEWCPYAVDYEIRYGAPATVTWKVPRILMQEAGAGAVLKDPAITTGRTRPTAV